MDKNLNGSIVNKKSTKSRKNDSSNKLEINKNLIFVNKFPSKFKEHKKYVKEMLEKIYKSLNLDCEIKIKFIDYVKENEFEFTDCMIANKAVRKHELIITNPLLNSINFDGGESFVASIYHEMIHIQDYNNMMKTNLFDFNFCLVSHKTFEKQFIATGFNFWTEVYAYYNTFKFAKLNNIKNEKITFGYLTKIYEKTIECNKNFYYKQNLSYDEAVKYIKYVDSFIYLCSKYMASTFASNSRIPRTKIEKNKNYKKVFLILSQLEPKVEKLFNNIYGANSYKNLLKLGKCICVNLKWKKFKVGLVKEHGKVYPFY